MPPKTKKGSKSVTKNVTKNEIVNKIVTKNVFKNEIDINKLVDCYMNDGFVYCIKTNMTSLDKQLVKIGKIGMKMQETEDQVYEKLLRRYNTYYTDYDVLHFKRTGNCHEAEKYIFQLLQNYNHVKEHYYYNEKIINDAFENMSNKYQCIDTLLKKIDISDMSDMCQVNRMINKRLDGLEVL